MKRMRQIAAAALILSLALSLCGCGKSEVVTSVESVIAGIGQVSLENKDAVAAARSAYDILPEKLQAKVENAAVLTDAEAALAALEEEQARLAAEAEDARLAACAEPAKWLAGQWVSADALVDFIGQGLDQAKEAAQNSGITFNEDGTCLFLGTDVQWTCQNDVVTVQDVRFSLDNSAGYDVLKSSQGRTYIAKETMDGMFVTVEVTLDNIGDYVEFKDVTFDKYNSFHEFLKTDKWIFMANKVYDQGLVYLTQSSDCEFVADIGVDSDIMPRSVFHYTLYGPMSGSYIGMEFYAPFDSSTCSFTTAQGTIYYVRSQYAEVTVENAARTLKVLGKSVVLEPQEELRQLQQEQFHRIVQQEEYLYY